MAIRTYTSPRGAKLTIEYFWLDDPNLEIHKKTWSKKDKDKAIEAYEQLVAYARCHSGKEVA